MIKRNNKKGFTIVELVIVIAVIAILAAVLIPTFSGIVKKANLSADQQAVRQMNVVLAEEWATNGAPETKQAVLDALDNAGYNAKGEEGLVPVSKGHSFYFYMGENVVVLVKDDDNSIIFPDVEADVAAYIKDGTFIALKGGNMEASVEASNVDSLANALVTGNQEIKLTENVTLDYEYTIPAGAEVTLDLNGKTLATEKAGERSKYINIGKGATLTIVNGVIDARGVQVYASAKLVIGEGVTVNNVDSNGGAAIWVYEGGEVVIDGGTFAAPNGNGIIDDRENEPAVINNSGKLTINGGTFTANSAAYAIVNSGELIINNGTFTASRGVLAANSGTVTINGGTFQTTEGAAAHVVYAYDGVVTINGGTFTNNGTSEAFKFIVERNGSITVDGSTLTKGMKSK